MPPPVVFLASWGGQWIPWWYDDDDDDDDDGRKGGGGRWGRWWWQPTEVISSAQWTGNTIPVCYSSHSRSFTWFRDKGKEKHEKDFLTISQQDKISHALHVWCSCTIQPNPNTVSLFTHCNLWWYTEGCSKLKYYVTGSFSSYTFRGTKWGWQIYWFLNVYAEHTTSVMVISELLASAVTFQQEVFNIDCKVLVTDSNYARTTMLTLLIKTDTILQRIFETASSDVLCFNPSTWWHLNPSL